MSTIYIDSPVGKLRLVAVQGKLTTVHYESETPPASEEAGGDAALKDAARQLDEYFRGKRKTFDLELAPEGTDFDRVVWKALTTIPCGEKWSYLDLAKSIGQPTATRAVGRANGRNPIAIIVPCHRVIAADGTLGGYAGGLQRKRWLLAHEAELPLYARVNG